MYPIQSDHIGSGVYVVSRSYWGGDMTRVARVLTLGDASAAIGADDEIAHIEQYWAGLSATAHPKAFLARWGTTWAARADLSRVRRALLACAAIAATPRRGAWPIDDAYGLVIDAIVSGEPVVMPIGIEAPSEGEVDALYRVAGASQRREDFAAADEARDLMWRAMARDDLRAAIGAACAAAGVVVA